MYSALCLDLFSNFSFFSAFSTNNYCVFLTPQLVDKLLSIYFINLLQILKCCSLNVPFLTLKFTVLQFIPCDIVHDTIETLYLGFTVPSLSYHGWRNVMDQTPSVEAKGWSTKGRWWGQESLKCYSVFCLMKTKRTVVLAESFCDLSNAEMANKMQKITIFNMRNK